MLKRATINGVAYNELTDGETSRSYSFAFDGENITINIPTDDTHLSHMVIFVGDGGPHWRDEDRNHTMDYVSISCDNHGPDYYSTVCGEPSSPVNRLKDITRGIRINLRYMQAYAVNLQFPGNVVKQINLAEIEIYAYEISNKDRARLLGCFKTPIEFRRTYNHFNLDKCFDDCHPFDPIAISRARKECSCGFTVPFDNEIDISKCKGICRGNRSCGAINAFSVYIMIYNVPYFMGCYKTQLVKPPNIFIEDITISKCLLKCQDFFSVGLGLGKCVCLDYQFVEHVPDRWLCNQPCSEEESICGGEEGVAVYRSCRYYFAHIDCFDLMKCKDDIFDHVGICTHGCQGGFAGEHCIERIIQPSSVVTEETTEPVIHTDTTRVATEETTKPVTSTYATKDHDDNNSNGKSFVSKDNYIISISILTSILVS